ncbi:MAG TPA: hypothetical protein VFF89_06640 [Sphingobium sp.]|nr:hypothetical protein [Sphingobium sp.]
MRSTWNTVTVRLYHLSEAEGSGAQTLLYGPLDQALALAARQDAATQAGLFIATDNDVIAYLDLIGE